MNDDGESSAAVPDPRRAPDERAPAPAVPLARRAEPVRPGRSTVATIAPPWLRAPAPVEVPATDPRPTDDRPGRGRAAVVALVARDGRMLGRRRLPRAAADPEQQPDPLHPGPQQPGPQQPGPQQPGPQQPGQSAARPVAVRSGAGGSPSGPRPSSDAPPVVLRPAIQRARPRIEPEPSILGLSRLTRGRVGSRVFTMFFVFVYALIAVQLVVSLLHG